MGLDHLITRNKKETMNSLHIISIADTNGKNHKSASLMSRIEEEQARQETAIATVEDFFVNNVFEGD